MRSATGIRLIWLTAMMALGGALPATAQAPQAQAPQGKAFDVTVQEVDDVKSVYSTVRSKDVIEARVRTPGTIADLKVQVGQAVEPGQLLGLVADPKIAIKIRALDAGLIALQSRTDTAKTELERAQALKERGVASQARVDQAQTAYDVAVNDLKAARAERAVVETQIEEGQVLAPATGRVLKVPVTVGSVVLAGESIATIAANEYQLRIELPERHARFIKVSDTIRLGDVGFGAQEKAVVEGRITRVYPELSNGRVVADAEVPGLGDYFVGERVPVRISAGKRKTVFVPRVFVFQRFGQDFVRLARADGKTADVVVQTGHAQGAGEDMVEILSGLDAGDKLVQP